MQCKQGFRVLLHKRLVADGRAACEYMASPAPGGRRRRVVDKTVWVQCKGPSKVLLRKRFASRSRHVWRATCTHVASECIAAVALFSRRSRNTALIANNSFIAICWSRGACDSSLIRGAHRYISSTQGIRKARVLPLPVRAAPSTSRPVSSAGTVRACGFERHR